jgi:tRNA(fMet)-specific endonuclease VapC
MLLDTNIVSFFFRRDTRARPYERHLLGQPRYIAFVTLAELYQWVILRPFTPQNRQRLLDHVADHIVLPFDDILAWRWAELSANCRRSGNMMSSSDLWIAATALRHNLPLVTHNRRHFANVPGLTIITEAQK